MSDLWGTAAGIQEFNKDAQSAALNRLALEEGSVKLDEARLKLQEERTLVDQQNTALAAMRKMASGNQMTGGVSTGQTGETSADSLPNFYDKMADIYNGVGLPEQGLEFATKSSTLRKNASEIATAQAKDAMQKATTWGQLLEDVTDQKSLDIAKLLYQSQYPGNTLPQNVAGLQYDPKTIEMIKDITMRRKDKAQIDLDKARKLQVEASTRLDNQKTKYYEEQAKITKTRDEQLRKNGGKVPKAGDVTAAQKLLTSKFDFTDNPAQAYVMGRELAERADQIMADEGVTRSVATSRAFSEAKDTGSFAGLKPMKGLKGSLDSPLSIPVGKDGVPDKSKMVANSAYALGGKYKGKVGIWNGTTFDLPSVNDEAVDDTDDDSVDDEDNDQ